MEFTQVNIFPFPHEWSVVVRVKDTTRTTKGAPRTVDGPHGLDIRLPRSLDAHTIAKAVRDALEGLAVAP